MNMIETRKYEIANRKVEIRSLLEGNQNDIDLTVIESELKNLETELADLEKRSAIVGSLKTIEKPEERGKNMNITYAESPEYRSAFFKRLQGKTLNDVEERAFTSAANSAGAAIPMQTADEIIKKVKQVAPLVSEITLLQVEGNVKFATEGTRADAALHAGTVAITPVDDTLISVNLGGYEIVKLVSVSKTVSTMSISAFENWIVDMLAEDIARKIESYLVGGTGTDEPQGVSTANTWDATNSVTVAKTASLTAANVQALIGLLSGGYDANGKFLMSKKTLFSDFMPLEDNSKNSIVRSEGNRYFVYGYPVLLSDYVPYHDAYLGDFKKIVGNLGQNITVEASAESGFRSNSIDYRGAAIFDSKVALGEAFVKLAKATA